MIELFRPFRVEMVMAVLKLPVDEGKLLREGMHGGRKTCGRTGEQGVEGKCVRERGWADGGGGGGVLVGQGCMGRGKSAGRGVVVVGARRARGFKTMFWFKFEAKNVAVRFS